MIRKVKSKSDYGFFGQFLIGFGRVSKSVCRWNVTQPALQIFCSQIDFCIYSVFICLLPCVFLSPSGASNLVKTVSRYTFPPDSQCYNCPAVVTGVAGLCDNTTDFGHLIAHNKKLMTGSTFYSSHSSWWLVGHANIVSEVWLLLWRVMSRQSSHSPLLSFSLITSRHGGVDFVAASMGERKTHLETIEAK